MKIHLHRSPELPVTLFKSILASIQAHKGPIIFSTNPNELVDSSDEESEILSESELSKYIAPETQKSLKSLSWEVLFQCCEDFRKRYKISKNDYVVVLTDHPNDQNWFSAWDASGKLNFFVQTSYWEYFVEADRIYPILYELASIPLSVGLCKDLDELKQIAHVEPKGCSFDYCINKEQIRLKLRTADICSDCRDRMINKHFDPALAIQIFDIFEGVRKQILYRERIKITNVPSRVEFDAYYHEFKFLDISNHIIKFSPKELVLYLFLLDQTDGIKFTDIVNHREDLLNLYQKYNKGYNDCEESNEKDARLTTLNNTIDFLVSNKNESLSNLINKINSKLRLALGEDIADFYRISGERNGLRKIKCGKKFFYKLTKDGLQPL